MNPLSTKLPSPAAVWHEAGEQITLQGLKIFVRRVNPGIGGIPTVFLHGFPSSSFDFHRLDPLLGGGARVYFDFPGYGLSSKPADYSYSLFEQADVVEGLLAKLQITTAHVVAHDMGTSVACELAARQNRGLLGFEMRTLVLMNGSVHLELAQLTPSQKLLRSPLGRIAAKLSSEFAFQAQIRKILAKPISHDDLEAMWRLLQHDNGNLRLPDIISYLGERTRFAKRWIGALTELTIPVGIIWGQKDPVATAAIAEALAAEISTAKLTWLPNLGHYPQLEEPAAVAAALEAFYGSP